MGYNIEDLGVANNAQTVPELQGGGGNSVKVLWNTCGRGWSRNILNIQGFSQMFNPSEYLCALRVKAHQTNCLFIIIVTIFVHVCILDRA